MNENKRKGPVVPAGHDVNLLIHALAYRAVLLSVAAEHMLGQLLEQKVCVGGLPPANM